MLLVTLQFLLVPVPKRQQSLHTLTAKQANVTRLIVVYAIDRMCHHMHIAVMKQKFCHLLRSLVQGMLQQCRRALKPDGLFLAAMFGGDTLHELRVSCNLAEEELQGGVSQRVSPLAQVRHPCMQPLPQCSILWLYNDPR